MNCIVRIQEYDSRYTTVCDGCPERQDCDDCTIDHETNRPTCSAVLDHTSAKVAGILLEELEIDNGYWRATSTSKLIFKCYNTDACKGGKTGTHSYCDTGYADKGPCGYRHMSIDQRHPLAVQI